MTSWPSNIKLSPKRIDFAAKNLTAFFSSMYTGQMQVVNYGGQYWELNVTLPVLANLSDAEEMTAFLNGLGGMRTPFLFNMPSKFLISAAQSLTINSDGNTFTGGVNVEVGKYGYSNNNRLVQFTGAGSLYPALPAGSATVDNVGGAYFRLSTSDVGYTVDELLTTQVVVPMREVVP